MKRRDFLRKVCFLPFIMVLVMMPVWSWGATEKVTAKDWRNGFVQVAKKVQPSVVSIRSERTVTASPGKALEKTSSEAHPLKTFSNNMVVPR